MSNKQIFIDCVDVSGCEYYNKDDKTCRAVNGKYETDICDFDKCENSNCYYKQLKYKEQECEELKESLKVWKYSDVQHIFKINKYEQTLTEIKAIVKQWINSAWFCFNCRSNMDEKLQKILDLITKAESEG